MKLLQITTNPVFGSVFCET